MFHLSPPQNNLELITLFGKAQAERSFFHSFSDVANAKSATENSEPFYFISSAHQHTCKHQVSSRTFPSSLIQRPHFHDSGSTKDSEGIWQ